MLNTAGHSSTKCKGTPMKDSKTLLQSTKQTISSASTPTQAGQKASDTRDKAAIIDAVNRVFAEFELVYHNQFIKAFPTDEKLQYGKQLWFNFLKDYSAEQILEAAHQAIKQSEFLPTVRGLLKFCENEYERYQLPEPRQAYVEACNAKSPKTNAPWSHPAVFHAGKACGWEFLASTAEYKAFDEFNRHYQKFCRQVRLGETLAAPQPIALEQKPVEPLPVDEQREHMAKLREQLKL